MDRFSAYSAGFSASHQGGISHTIVTTETRLHGHDWRVEVEAKTDEDVQIQVALDDLIAEFRGRTLEDMMPGASTTATGVATWLMERLSGRFAEITRVAVDCAGHRGYVTREARRSA